MLEDKAPEEQSRFIPDEYQGTLESNYYCRYWINSKSKYCEQRAGHNTRHSGVGRCKTHDAGSDKKLIHGKRSKYRKVMKERNLSEVERYRKLPPKLQDIYEEHYSDPDPLDIVPDIQLARTVLLDYINRYEEARETLEEWRHWYEGEFNSRPPKVELLPVEHVVTFLKKVTDIAHKEKKYRSKNAVSEADVHKIMGKMGRVVEHWVMQNGLSNEEKLKKIKEDWLEIQIDR